MSKQTKVTKSVRLTLKEGCGFDQAEATSFINTQSFWTHIVLYDIKEIIFEPEEATLVCMHNGTVKTENNVTVLNSHYAMAGQFHHILQKCNI